MANNENSEAAKKIAKAEKEKASKKSKKNKENIFIRIWKAIKRYFKDLKGEVKKITWPGAKEVLKGTVVTIVCIAIIGVVIFLVDLGLTKGINGLRTVAENRTAVSEEASDTTKADADADDLAAALTEAASEAATSGTTTEATKAAK